MDDSERITEETAAHPEEDDLWTMPVPVFRSTEGRDPRYSQADIPTEPIGFVEGPTEVPDPPAPTKEDPLPPHEKKRTGWLKAFTLIGVIVGLLIGAVIAALIYFLFFYRPASTVF